MKTIILYGRRNVGMIALVYLWGKFPADTIKLITDDENMIWFAKRYGIERVTFRSMGEFDIFLCCHGDKILPKQYLKEGKMVNIHPCLWKYKGQNPIKRYILNEDEEATVESHWLIEEVDAGEVIHREDFHTGKVSTYEAFYNIAFPVYIKVLDKTIEKILT